MTYYDYPITTTVEHFTVNKLDFPSVTICNNNYIRKSYIKRINDPAVEKAIYAMGGLLKPSMNFSGPAEVERMSQIEMFNFSMISLLNAALCQQTILKVPAIFIMT